MALIIGHSQTKYFDNYIDSNDNVKVFCDSGCSVKNLLSNEVTAAIPNASILVVHCGINDIPRKPSDVEADMLMNKFDDLYTDIRNLNRRCDVVISGILPRVVSRHNDPNKLTREEIRNVNTVVVSANNMIQLAATTDEKLHFIDHPSFHNDNGTVDSSLLSKDGLHLSYKGTPTVVNTIMNKIRSIQESSYPSSVIVPSASDEICNQGSDNVVEGPYCYSETVKLFPPAQSNTGKVSAVKPNVRKVSSLRSIPKDTKIKQSRTVISKYKYQNNNVNTRPPSENVSRTKGTTVNKKCKTEKNSTNQTKSNPNRFCVLKHHKCKTVLRTSECKTRDKKKKAKLSSKEIKKKKMYKKNAELNKLVKFINTPTRSWETKVCNGDPNLDQNCEMRKVKQSGGGGETTSSENDTNESDGNSKIPESENQDISVSGQNTGADSGSKIYMNSEKELSALDVIEIFRHVDVTKIVDETDFRPKGKNVFVIGGRNGNVKNEDWKADGYTWKRYGTKKVKVNDEGAYLCKMYYKLMNQNSADERFKKHVFKMENDENLNLILIQYIGDETIFVPQPHGNNKKSKNEYVRTKPSVLNKIKDHTAKNPVSVMNKINSKINAPCKETGFSTLRNKRQVINTQSRLRKQQGLGPDSLYNLHQLFYHLDGYITDIVTAPDLIVLLQMKDMQEEFDRLLQLKSDEAVPLFYDTTFNLGDFYVSTLSFQHILFDTPPVIPLAIMIHERKFQKCHEMLFNSVKQRIPRLKDKNLPIVTDRETGIINAIKNVFPNLTLLICWNHILRDTKEWLRKNGENEQNTLEIVKQIKCLLESSSEEAYDTLLNGGSGVRGFRVIWSQLFVTYFDKQLAPTIKNHAAKWVVEESDVYNPFSGITNNASESNHARYKKLLDFKEKEVDIIVLYMQYLQNNDINSLMKGFCALGDLTLRKKFQHLKKDPDNVELKSVLHPDDIIKRLKGEINEPLTGNTGITEQEIKTEENQTEPGIGTNVENNERIEIKADSQLSLAGDIINDKGITLVPEMGGFMVKGKCSKLYAVKLFPKESCQCPSGSTGRCYHILAAKKSINMPTDQKPKTVNLTQLRKRTRSRADKKSGRKKPRTGDIDTTIVNPAPDSIMLTTIIEDIEYVEENDDLTANPQFAESTPKHPLKSPQTPRSILRNKQVPDTESKKKLRFDNISKNIKVEIPSKPFDLPDLDDMHKELEQSRSFEQDECPDKSIWVNSLSLSNSDKFLLLNNKKLNSDHMEAVNILARKQYQNIQGLQLTEKVPEYIKAERRWHAGTVMNPVTGLSCQIHHTHADHWVISFQENGEISLFDSLGTDRPLKSIITPSLEIQLSLLYGKDKSSLHVILPDTQRQNNGYDCGLFAIAHLVEFCSKGSICPNVIFDTTKMRKHLAACFETECLLEFPKTDKSLNMRRKKEQKFIDIPLVCMCNLPECLDDLVQCGQCNSWFHKHCVVAPADISKVDISFACENCAT